MFHHLQELAYPRKNFVLDEGASVAVTSALAIPALLGIAGLALEFGDALVTRAETQRVADLAVHAGVLAYARNGNTEEMELVARNVARLNGFDASATTVRLDQTSAAGPVVRVTITTPRPLLLSQLIAASHSVDVTVRSAAMLEEEAVSCIQALDAKGSGITMTGGTSITAEDCAVASNATVGLSEGASIVTRTLYYDSDTAPSITGGASVTSPDGGAASIIRAPAADPMAEHAALALAQSRLAHVAGLQPVIIPTVSSGPNIEFGWNANAEVQASAVGCSASRSGSTWSFACPSGATVNLGNLTIGGGLSLNFGTQGTADTTYNFSGFIRNTGEIMRFGPGTYTVARGIVTGGGTTTLFDAGTFRLGPSTASCDGATGHSICNTSTLAFGGPSTFEMAGGIRNSGGATLTLGAGVGNSFRIGKAANGAALRLEGNTILGDATGAGNRFEVVGNIITGGGTCLSLGAAANHDIAGHLNLSGGVIFGSGVYTIDGYLHLGASQGGSVACWGESISMRALDVTLVLSGKGPLVSNQNCNGQAAFCAASGYDTMRLVAPKSGPFANLAVIGPLASGVTAGASFGGGASGSQISGAFYFPNGPILLTGGASAGSGTDGGCLQIIGATVTMDGGTATASDCNLGGATGGGRVRLIQ